MKKFIYSGWFETKKGTRFEATPDVIEAENEDDAICEAEELIAEEISEQCGERICGSDVRVFVEEMEVGVEYSVNGETVIG